MGVVTQVVQSLGLKAGSGTYALKLQAVPYHLNAEDAQVHASSYLHQQYSEKQRQQSQPWLQEHRLQPQQQQRQNPWQQQRLQSEQEQQLQQQQAEIGSSAAWSGGCNSTMHSAPVNYHME